MGLSPVGLDVSPAYAAKFRAHGAGAVIGSASTLPFADASFGGVWCIGVLHHLSDEDARLAVREMRRVTRPGGYTVIFDGVLPVSFSRRPLAWSIRRMDRGAHFRREQHFLRLLDEGAWQTTRLTYATTGLEGMWCNALKPSP